MLKEAATLASVCAEQIRTLAAQKRRASDSRPQFWPHARIGVGAHPSTRAHQQCRYVTPPLLRRGRRGSTTAAAAAAGACFAAGLTKGSGGRGFVRAPAPDMTGRLTHDAARQHCPLPLHRRGGRGGRHPRCPRPACRPVTCRTTTNHRHTHCVVARPGRSVLWPAPPGTSCPSTPPTPPFHRRLFSTPPPPISTAAPSPPLFSLTACHASVAPPHDISHVAQPRSHGPEEGSIPPLPSQERAPYRITRSGKRGRQRYKTEGTVYLPATTAPPTVVALRPKKGGNRCVGPNPLMGIGPRRRPTNTTKYNARQVPQCGK